jgi:hypothetical protein
MARSDTARFRHHQAILAGAIVAALGALPLAGSRTYLLPVLLVPVTVAVWAWRAGTDADVRGLRVRALAGQRRIAWEQVAQLGSDPRGRAVAQLDDGRQLVLPAVRREDLPRLVAAAGRGGPAPDQ